MRSVILISPNNKEVVNLFQQWENKATNIYLDNDKLNMVINGERIYIDYCENGDADYEEDELINIDIGTPLFYSICYSDKDAMKYFIQNSIFGKGSFIDNDLGKVVRLDELMKEEPNEVQKYLGNQGVSSSTVFTLDNRRLYAAKQAGVKVNSIWATQEDLNSIDLIRRFTTVTGGKTIDIR